MSVPPLVMQDDTLGIPSCGFKSKKMNSFMNMRANIMGFQLGRDKCEKMHIGKKKINRDICIDGKADAWKDTILKDDLGQYTIVDKHVGKEVMKNVKENTYLGQIIPSNGKHEKNLQDKISKAVKRVSSWPDPGFKIHKKVSNWI